MTKSQTAESEWACPNNPSEGDHQENLRLLCERVLQPVRDHFNHTSDHILAAIVMKFCSPKR